MRNFTIALLASLLMIGCSKNKSDNDQSVAKPASVEADNTGKNVRDRMTRPKLPVIRRKTKPIVQSHRT